MTIDLATIESLAANTTASIVSLSPTTINILLSALADIEDYRNWNGAGFELTDAETDAIDAYLAKADYEVLTKIMIGSIVPYATETIPAGLLPCDGATYLKADYPALAAVIHSAFNVDSTHFKVPDLRGRTIIGTGDGVTTVNRVMGDSLGEESHVLTITELAAHVHGVAGINNATATGGVGTRFTRGNGTGTPADSVTQNAGNDVAHNNMQPSLALGYGISYQ